MKKITNKELIAMLNRIFEEEQSEWVDAENGVPFKAIHRADFEAVAKRIADEMPRPCGCSK
jgi:hypothetical protein